MRRSTAIGLVAVAILWTAGIAGGLCALQHYAQTPGAGGRPDPAAQTFFERQRNPQRPLLVMAVHPMCPCTDASLAELGDLLARSRGACDALLVQYHPLVGAPDWPVDELPRRLGGVSVRVLLDPGGKIGATLGAKTSGHTVFVDATGRVRFQGGLTLARGHRGRSPAQDAILEIMANGSPKLTSAPVYGCALETECGIAGEADRLAATQ